MAAYIALHKIFTTSNVGRLLNILPTPTPTPPQAQHQVQCRLLLDVVVSQGAAILQLLAGEDEALLVGRDACTEVKNHLIRAQRRIPQSKHGQK